jgi:hypothetical protein
MSLRSTSKTQFDYQWRWFHTSYLSGGASDETTGVTEEEKEFFEQEPQEGDDLIDFAVDNLYDEDGVLWGNTFYLMT